MIWSGQAFSIITSGASGWAIIWHVTITEGSALKLAIVMALSQLPLGLLAPLGGVAADRYNRRAVMIVSDLGAGVMSLTLGALAWLGHGSFAVICIFAVLRSCFQAFHFPAMSAAMPMLVPEKHLMRVNTLDQAIGSIANIGSPAIGIALYTAFGLPYTLGLEFLGALLAVAGLALARIPSVEAEMPPTIMGQIREGWRALSANVGLVYLIIALTVGIMVFEALAAVYPLMAQQYFGADGAMVSVAEAITGTCMLLGALIMMAWGGGKRLALLISATTVVVGLPFAAVGIIGLIVGTIGRHHRAVFFVSLALTIIAPMLGVYLGARQSAKIPALLQELANRFKIDYVCPKCGTFLGEIPWESLAKKKRCPTNGCRAKWVNDNKP